MQIAINNNHITGYARVGNIVDGVEISTNILPDDFCGNPTKYCYTPDKGIYPDPDYPTAELVRTKADKITELSAACEQAIIGGAAVGDKHYSMALTDQLNLESLKTSIMAGAEAVPYHADGESCTLYTADDFVAIYNACATHKIRQITYYNQLRQYVEDMASADDVRAVTYGQALTGKYLDAYNTIMSGIIS